ncbi:MAG: LbtU family siderophore porin [Thermodesulfobacteriota bacterium]
MRKSLRLAAVCGLALLGAAERALALSTETELLLDLLEKKGVISAADANGYRQAIAAASPPPATGDDQHMHTVRSIEQRVEKLEQTTSTAAVLGERISVSGIVEVEAFSATTKDPAGGSGTTSDIRLATAELDFDARVNDLVGGHLALLYEEDVDNGGDLNIDEGFVTLAAASVPWYGRIGKMYVPFGNYESHFISDPLPLALGETGDTALLGGYAAGPFDLSLGVFNGSIDKSGKSDKINAVVAAATVSLPGLPEGSGVSGGVSYLSNLAASDGLQGEAVVAGEVADLVDGLSAYLHLDFLETFAVEAEYLTALADFAATDFTFTDAANRRPRAWNLEAAMLVLPQLEATLRYGGSEETGTLLAENQYGVVLRYDLFDNTALALEYLDEKFRDDSRNRQTTMQVAVEF